MLEFYFRVSDIDFDGIFIFLLKSRRNSKILRNYSDLQKKLALYRDLYVSRGQTWFIRITLQI